MHNPTVRGPLTMMAIDPGGTTGWLVFRPVVDPGQLTGYGIAPIEWGEEKSQTAFCDMLWKRATARLAYERLDGIVIEGWRDRPGIRDFRPEALEILGVARWLMSDDPSRLFVQDVVQATAFGTDAKIRPYRREKVPPLNVGHGGQGHAVKALQHAVLWVNTRWSPEARP